ncbi:GNAT family N-acetyltransferase [uncultured Parasphingorhabdus sp.]|uniref:GNAT family N-acetyltransferase n=1 Tax=uncultured Parasphingorhabdus sp. TaxID=2709694 RepID=UPI002AA6A377|nr:GNAT family N-acetyltransferase [uncultured Parasphingorhabdus sp.]
MAGISIRAATSDDAPSLPEIESSAAKAYLSVPGLEWIAGEAPMPADSHRIYIAEGSVWVAVTDRHCVGFLASTIFDDALHIIELSVADGYQGQGIGRRLMETAREFAAEQNSQALTLTTFRDLPFNEHFYRTLGYQTLESAEMPKRLADILTAESENGLPGNRRCAMRLML